MTRARWMVAVIGCLLAIVLAGCGEPAPPHGHVGTFDVRANMMINSCGPQSVSIAAHLQYEARLGYDRGVATWELTQSRVSATGLWTEVPPSFRFTHESYSTLRAADSRYGLAACVMRRYDLIEGTLSGALRDLSLQPLDAAISEAGLDATAMDGGDLATGSDGGTTTFGATETIAYGVAEGADCRDFIGVGSGQFLTLPCQITYAMDGTMVR